MVNFIGDLRKQKSIKQELLAKEVQITRPFLSNIENSKQKPSYDIALRIAKALGEPFEKVFSE